MSPAACARLCWVVVEVQGVVGPGVLHVELLAPGLMVAPSMPQQVLVLGPAQDCMRRELQQLQPCSAACAAARCWQQAACMLGSWGCAPLWRSSASACNRAGDSSDGSDGGMGERGGGRSAEWGDEGSGGCQGDSTCGWGSGSDSPTELLHDLGVWLELDGALAAAASMGSKAGREVHGE